MILWFCFLTVLTVASISGKFCARCNYFAQYINIRLYRLRKIRIYLSWIDNGCARTPGVPSVPGNDKRLITLSSSYRSFDTGTFILTGDLATGGFNRSTVVAVQDVVKKVFLVVFFLHYNTTGMVLFIQIKLLE